MFSTQVFDEIGHPYDVIELDRIPNGCTIQDELGRMTGARTVTSSHFQKLFPIISSSIILSRFQECSSRASASGEAQTRRSFTVRANYLKCCPVDPKRTKIHSCVS